jgi:Ca-activated chloride channel homolog
VTFDHPNSLWLLLLLPVLWLWMRSAPGASLSCLALKCAAFAVLVLALADPWAEMRVAKLAVTVLVDTSASMPRESLERSQTMLQDLVRRKTGADLRLITFAGHANLHPIPAQADKVAIPQGVDPNDGKATDLEAALQLALDTFPADGARRVLLITDGNETQGHVLTEALRARERGIPVFTEPSGGTAPLPVQLASIASPQDVFSGERFPLSLQLNSARALPVRVWAAIQGQEIGSTTLTLEPGSNRVELGAQTGIAGVNLVEVHISSGAGNEQLLASEAVTVRQPHVLYIAGGGESSAPLLATLKTAQIDVQAAKSFPTDPAQQGWDAVLLDNYPDHDLSAEESKALEAYAFRGGGLIYIAGDKNAKFAREPKTPFDKVLPVRALPPPEKPAAVVLVLDKSGSMEGQKIEMVRAAAHASILPLRPFDKLGIISFDEDFNWVVPLGPASDLESKGALIDGIQAEGDTKIWQATQAAFDAIIQEEASSRHIILLTDGETTYKVVEYWPQLEKDAAAKHVSISTIGIGDDVNRSLLEEIARATNGKSHFVQNPSLIPQIINDEVRPPDDLAIQERPVRAIALRPVEFTDGIDFSRAPRLLGFVQAEAKDGAETILRVDGDKPLPLLVRWHYGLGSVIAFLSDAKSRWATPWVRWESFGALWPQMVRDVSHRDQTVRASVQPGTRPDQTIVSYDVLPAADNLKDANDQIEQDLSLPGSPSIVVQDPGQASHALPLEETNPGHYEARIATGQPGLYRIRSGSSELTLPEVGYFRESDETKPRAVNVALLAEVSRLTGGSVRPSIDQLLNDKGSLVTERRALWPYLLVLALMINFLEVAIRKNVLEGLTAWLRRRVRSPWSQQPA